jgi:peptidoglycan/LPS O-acetylase OafA/YrhL
MVVFGPTMPPHSTRDYILRTSLSFSPWCGVWMFFTLSGYLMGKGFVTGRHTVNRDGLVRFYKNRILRIFPIYFVSIFLVAVFMNPAYLDVRNPASLNTLLEAGLFDQQAGGVIGALWSVSTEFQFYLIAPMLFLLLSVGFKRNWSRVTAVAAVGILIGMTKLCILNRVPTLWHSRVYFPLLLNLDCFLAGMAASFAVNGLLKKRLYVPRGIAIGIVITILAQIGISSWSFHEMAAYEGVPGSATRLYYLSFAPGATALVTCLIIGLFELAKRTPSAGNLAWRVSSFLGALTYCFYVFHEPVILSLRRLWPATLKINQAMIIFPFGFAVALAVACIFYYFVETRFDRLRSRPAE